MNDQGEAAGSGADRKYFRVRTSLPLRVTRLDADHYQKHATTVLSRIDPDLPEADPALIGWLDRIERKIDRVLAELQHGDLSAMPESWNRTTELSGSGLSFASDESFPTGTLLQLEFELPETPVRRVRCIGWVADQSGAGSAEEIGVAFGTIRQVDRDAVVGHTLAVQRQELRVAGSDGSADGA